MSLARRKRFPIYGSGGQIIGYQYGPRRGLRTMRRRVRARRQFVPRTMGPFSASESKYFDAETDDFTIPGNTAWAATNDIMKGTICLPQEGSDIDNRIGRKIAVYKIAIRGIIKQNPATDQADILANPAIRIIFWMDQQTNATATNSAQLMAAPTAAEADNVFCTFQNTANFGRFRVFRDIVLSARDVTSAPDGNNTSSQNAVNIPFKFVVRFRKPIIVRFNGTNGGTIGDVVDNSFYLSAQKSAASFTHLVTTISRVYYKDQ